MGEVRSFGAYCVLLFFGLKKTDALVSSHIENISGGRQVLLSHS